MKHRYEKLFLVRSCRPQSSLEINWSLEKELSGSKLLSRRAKRNKKLHLSASVRSIRRRVL